MILYFIRHGEYSPRQGASHDENTAVGLNEFGKTQSAAVARFFLKRGLDIVYASPLARAMETAAIIASICKIPVRTDDRLSEFVATLHTTDRDLIKETKRRARADHDFIYPDGESINQAVARFRQAVEEIAVSGQERVALITHEMVLQFFLSNLFSLRETPNLRTASIATVVYENGIFRPVEINRTAWSFSVLYRKIMRKVRIS